MANVAVIIPNYNHADYLRQRIDSVLNQTYRDFNILILDDCSTDHSRQIIQSYAHLPNVQLLLNDTNTGSTFIQWNRGIQATQSKYIWIAESDDVAHPTLLQTLVQKLDANPLATIAYCQSNRIDDQGQHLGSVLDLPMPIDTKRFRQDLTLPGPSEVANTMIHANTIVNASAAVFRRDACQRVGGANESLRLCGDWLFWMQLALLGQIEYVSEHLNQWRCHRQTVRHQADRQQFVLQETVHVLARILPQIDTTPAVRDRVLYNMVLAWGAVSLRSRPNLARQWQTYKLIRQHNPHTHRHLLRATGQLLHRLATRRLAPRDQMPSDVFMKKTENG